MAAVRAEMPGIAVKFASIGFVMVFALLFGMGSGPTSEPRLKTHNGETGEIEKQLAASAFQF